MSEAISVSQVIEMTAEELRSRQFIKLSDPENLTSEHIEKLRLLVNGVSNHGGIDLAAVNEKLQDFDATSPANSAPSSSFSWGSRTPDVNDPINKEALRLDFLRSEHKAYNDLIQDGGRPSHRPHDSSFDYLYEPHTGIIQYWITYSPARECIFEVQRSRWTRFREHQDWRRGRYWKKEWFEKFVQEVRDYRRKKGLEGDICLQQDRSKQSRLDDWKEFQYWGYTTADGLVKEIKQAGKAIEASEVRVQAVIDAGRSPDGVERFKELGLYINQARQGTAEIDLRRQHDFLKWVDEQVPIIASECHVAGNPSHTLDNQSTSINTTTAKRKRSTDDIDHPRNLRRKLKPEERLQSSSLDCNKTIRNLGLDRGPEPELGNKSNLRPRQPRKNTHQNKRFDLNLQDSEDGLDMAQRAKRKPTRSSQSRPSQMSKAQAGKAEFQPRILKSVDKRGKDLLPPSSGPCSRTTALKFEKEHAANLKPRRSERISQKPLIRYPK